MPIPGSFPEIGTSRYLFVYIRLYALVEENWMVSSDVKELLAASDTHFLESSGGNVSSVAEDSAHAHGSGSSPDLLFGDGDLDDQRRSRSRTTVALPSFPNLQIRCRCAPGRPSAVIRLEDAKVMQATLLPLMLCGSHRRDNVQN